MQSLIQKASDATYTASGIAASAGVLTWMSFLDEHYRAIGALCAIVGVVVGICTFFVNWFYKHKAHK